MGPTVGALGEAKNDRIDSEKIARILRGGMFPYAYVYPRGMRAHRDLMRRQIKLTRERGELMSHIKNTLSQYNLPANTENLRYAKHREPLRTAFPDPSVQRSIDLDLARIEFYDEQLAKLQWYLKKTAKSVDPNTIIRLKSVHGITCPQAGPGCVLHVKARHSIRSESIPRAALGRHGQSLALNWYRYAKARCNIFLYRKTMIDIAQRCVITPGV